MVAPFGFDQSWHFDASPDELWAVLMRPDDYREWWSWLRRCDVDVLEPGRAADCVVQSPLPYALRFRVTIESLAPARHIHTQVSGDLEGPARLEILPRDSGCEARLVWSVELRDPVLRRLARFTRPAMTWAHDRVVDLGVAQFRRRALDKTA